jgi:DNA-binding CsgD family transcriptional regulator
VASLTGAAEHADGLRHDDPVRLNAAVRTLRASPRRLALAAALEDAGWAEVRTGDREAGLHGLAEALETYARCGARRDAARVQMRLREHGVRRRPAAGALTPDASGRLTPSELRVALLVAEGLSNRQVADRLYLSPHTVDSHLRHAFTKLGLRSRVELTRLLLAGSGR